MGTLTFLLPANLAPDSAPELERAYLTGGQDNMPYATRVSRTGSRLLVERDGNESGNLVVPWHIEGAGILAAQTATVIERVEPYSLPIELARGKVNQVRQQLSDWTQGGLEAPAHVSEQVHQATKRFGHALARMPDAAAEADAQAALSSSYRAADDLVAAYVEQMCAMRLERQQRLETKLGCWLQRPLPPQMAHDFVLTFNTVCIPFSWRQIEPAEAEFSWQDADALLDWASAQGLSVRGGPLIDFSSAGLPDWLWLWQGDLSSIVAYICDFVETTVRRYRGRVRTWQLTAHSNAAQVLSLGEDELLWLTVRIAQAARHADPDCELVSGISQPWGELMATRERKRSPFEFVDTLLRAGLNLAALDLELVMGVSDRGSYCRDPLEICRLIDLYSLLGAPLHITLGYPSATVTDPHAAPELKVDSGHWLHGIDADSQAEWAAAVARLALCKPCVRSVQWLHLEDGEQHMFPNCGLVDAAGQSKPAYERLRRLRRENLR